MFIDEAQIYVKAGNGGPGGKSFLREKNRPFGGPAGGDGGAGGSVYLVATTGLNSLSDFRYNKDYCAPNGEKGGLVKCAGRDAEDINILVPCGTQVRNATTQDIIVDMVTPNQKFLLAKGGKGGLGNYHFKTSKKQAPTYAQPGLPGEEYTLDLELKLIAEIGFVGFPNAGKSTLLRVLTKATPKVGAYPFTTLHPHLGVLYLQDREVVLADIPGLIEGASQGLGLGDEFLRHIERTKYIIHLVDASGFSGDPVKNFRIINKELKAYSEKLAKKKQLIVLNKIDVPESIEYVAQFKAKIKKKFVCISGVTGEGTDELKIAIDKLLKA